MLDRRSLILAAPAALTLPLGLAHAEDDELAALEQKSGGRLGVAAMDTGSGRTLAHRAEERFAMCSTFKLLLAGAILHRVDAGDEHLARQIAYTKADLIGTSQVTTAHVADGHMSVEDLCEAVVTVSDNTAANLLLAALGGPGVVTLFATTLGDNVTHLDRTELALNDVQPGDERDTTSPRAMLHDVGKLFLTTVLSDVSRALLEKWAKGCLTGKTRLRAGLPADWVVGDKTGTGFRGEANDIAIAWRPHGAPVLITAYYNGSPGTDTAHDDVLADVARIVAKRFS